MLTKSPLGQTSGKTIVHVAGGDGPYGNTRAVLARIDLSPASGKRVLLKPNAGRVAPPGKGITTHAQVVAAAIDAFLEAGATVAIGESPIVGVETMEALAAAGLAEVAKERDCLLLDLNQRPFKKIPVPEGKIIKSLKVCPEVLEYDLVVSLPVMKMHMHTGVTLSVKNMKGCLWKRSKVEFHMLPSIAGVDEKSIDIAIADLASVLCPHLSIIDGTVGMEGLGPSAGESKDLDVVVAGALAFAADAVACELMGTRAAHIPHLRLCAERGYGLTDLEGVEVAPENWRKWASPFAPPPENLSIHFPNIEVLDKNSCSACQSTLLLFLKRYRKILFDYFPSDLPVRIAIGKGHENIPEGTLCIGNCTLAHHHRGVFIKGCPPVSSEIIQGLSGRKSVDFMDGRSETPETD